MSFKELFKSFKERENEKLSLLSGELTSSNLNKHLEAIKEEIFYLSHEVFLASKSENAYWSYCSTETYFENYNNRYNESLKNDFNEIHNESEFVESEITTLKNLEKHFGNTNYHPDLMYPIRKKIKLLEYKLETLNPTGTEILIDYSNSSCVEKIIFLHQVGVLDYLRKLSPFNLSTNKLAEYLSSITGEKAITLQSNINPIFNSTTSQKNNPLNTKSTVKKVLNKLAIMGFSVKNTN